MKSSAKRKLLLAAASAAMTVSFATAFMAQPSSAPGNPPAAAAIEPGTFAFGDEPAPAALAAAAPTAQAQAPASLQAEASGAVSIRSEAATGGASLVRVERGGDLFPQARQLAAADKATAFLERHGAIFGIDDVGAQLRMIGLNIDQYGHTRVSWQQMHGDVPVFGAVLHGHVSSDGRLTAINGNFVPELPLPTQPTLAEASAAQTAVAAVSAELRSALKGAQPEVASTALIVYRKYLTRGTPGPAHLAYEIEVTHQSAVREFVYVDALNGKVVDRITGLHGAKSRRVYEGSYDPDNPELPPPAWREGDLRPAADPAHEDEVSGAGQSYNLYFNLSGGTYRSWDGNDAEMITVNNDPTILCPNANWNGTSTNYCTGTSADDVVVHEWSHAYTQETSGLIYQWQSGALNESYSDIFGETVDLINNREGVEGTAATGDNGPRSQDESVCSEFTSEAPTGDTSLRWLIGEDAFAFSPLPPVGDAAIRDMWNPQCSGGVLLRGDPGHMSSDNYYCGSGDAGGVHYNSAINNRAYATLVDGNTIELRDGGEPFDEPITVDGIGLTKAAHIFWRANSVYNVPSTTMPQNADSLEMACEDLIGVNLTKLVTTAEDGTGLLGINDDTIDPTPELSGEVITADDCAQVANAIAAVEMRFDVTKQCGFSNLLDPAPAPRCDNAEVRTFFSEDWEGGLPAGWSTGQAGVSKAMLDTREWFVRSGDLPANPDGSAHGGSAIFQENRRDLGNCTTDDESGTLFLDSPAITVDASDPSHLVFEHYVNTETGYDGGNVMLSINGGPFELIPSDAFVHNPYNASLTSAADQNTNPKAGEPAWTGSNDNSVFGDWGESQIDLAAAGVAPGDTIVLRFDFGQDGCNGNDGWYVDDIELFTCGEALEPPTESCRVYPAEGFLPVVGSPIVSLVGSTTTATVDGESEAISDVSVRDLTGAHTYMGDLTFELTSPAGTTITLFDGSNCSSEDGIDVEFDDDAGSVIGCGDWLSGGAFRPHQALAGFAGEAANGEWTLTVTDSFPQDEGQIDSWSLEFCTPIDDPEPGDGADEARGSGKLFANSAGSESDKDQVDFHFNPKRQSDTEISGQLNLKDRVADVRIHMTDISYLGPVQGSCGSITDSVNAFEFSGSGTFDRKADGGMRDATFRACALDADEFDANGNKTVNGGESDRFYLECIDGCDYSTAGRVDDDVLDKGNIRIKRQPANDEEAAAQTPAAGDGSASTVFLSPALLSSGLPGSLQQLEVTAYDGDLQPISNGTVTLTQQSADGSTQVLQALTDITGQAVFQVVLLDQLTWYDARVDAIDSNGVSIEPALP